MEQWANGDRTTMTTRHEKSDDNYPADLCGKLDLHKYIDAAIRREQVL